MGLFSRIFKSDVTKDESYVFANPECKKIFDLKRYMDSLLSEKRYIAKSEFTVLQCLSHVSEKKYYGVTMLVDILRGANSQKIVTANLNSLPEYGKLKGVSRDDLITIIEWLIENHYILKTRHPQYPVLHPTYEGMHYSETITVGKLNKLLNTLLN